MKYRSKQLVAKIAKNKQELISDKISTPYINDEYYCGTCGNIGKSHPITSMCYVCGDDNWIPVSDSIGR